MAILTAILLLWWLPKTWILEWRAFLAGSLDAASRGEIGIPIPLLQATGWLGFALLGPIFGLAWAVAMVSTVIQGGFVFSPKAVEPKVEKLSPVKNLKKLVSPAALSQLLKTLLPLGMILYLAVGVFSTYWDQILHASQVGTRVSFHWILSLAFEMAWKAGMVLLVWSGFDYLLQKINFERELRMSREDIREEVKETEGNPTVRVRIKRLQRQMREKRMVQDVSQATVVVTNPNHFAVAIQYQPEKMDAPRVLAKGQNLLAQQIKRIARWNEIPIVENAPLAQALYRAVDVGQAIPAKLYTAVAEILAFIYRAQAQMGGTQLPGPSAEGPTGV